MARQRATVVAGTTIAQSPNWTTLPNSPVTDIQADHRIETDIDVNGIGRVRMRPGYPSAAMSEIRYSYGSAR